MTSIATKADVTWHRCISWRNESNYAMLQRAIKLLSRGLRPTPPPRLGSIVVLAQVCVCVCANLLCCGRSCRVLLVHNVSRISSWNVFFSIPFCLRCEQCLFGPIFVKIKNCFWKSPRRSMWSPWCQKCIQVAKWHEMWLSRPPVADRF